MASSPSKRSLLSRFSIRKKRSCISSEDELETMKVLGKGSFGEVVLMYHRPSKTHVAVKKVLLESEHNHPEVLEQLRNEQRILASVSQHPNIVTMLASWQTPTYFAIVMPYIEGRDLFQIIRVCRRLHSQEAARYISQLALALDHIHNCNVVYRDLKLENVLLDPCTDTVKIIDFGLSKMFDPASSHRTNTICGTLQYMGESNDTKRQLGCHGQPSSLYCKCQWHMHLLTFYLSHVTSLRLT
eukprot:m.71099 g.71099  ORF g.71099 m.71099 type:complete len:242 (-) comp12282_c0_seq4:3289-4014(-)